MNWFTTEDPALKKLHFRKVAICVVAIILWIALYAMFILNAFTVLQENPEAGPLAPAAISSGWNLKMIPFISILGLLPIKKKPFLVGAIVVNAIIALWVLYQILTLDLG